MTLRSRRGGGRGAQSCCCPGTQRNLEAHCKLCQLPWRGEERGGGGKTGLELGLGDTGTSVSAHQRCSQLSTCDKSSCFSCSSERLHLVAWYPTHGVTATHSNACPHVGPPPPSPAGFPPPPQPHIPYQLPPPPPPPSRTFLTGWPFFFLPFTVKSGQNRRSVTALSNI